MVISLHIYSSVCRVLPDSGTVPTGLSLGIIRLSRTALLILRIHQNTPLLHISGLPPERGYMLNNTIIHFLHMEPSNPAGTITLNPR